ncbi:MAG: sugar phosphate isomerase/epimerase [Lentisphaeria bacterium]|nr:sugar phosphate isomerase/epimerase [Lentisphaeria bacterium]
MERLPVSHCFSWTAVSEKAWDSVFAEFRDNGAERLILVSSVASRLAEEPELKKRLRSLLDRHGMRFDGSHAPWGKAWDLNETDPDARKIMLCNQKRLIGEVGEFGVGNVVIHIGDSVCRRSDAPPVPVLRDLAVAALEELLPAAEKAGVVIAIENIIAPTDTVEELLAVFGRIDSPYLGCCYDSGHENVMTPAPGKRPEMLCDYIRDTLWHGAPRLQERILERLLPYIVCCHLHDNDGLNDAHALPGDGTVDWARTVSLLRRSPRLASVQNEMNCIGHGISIRRMVETYERLWKGEGI